jgi:hypothetical protein
MPSTLRTLALSAWLVTLSSGCALHQSYDPALPAERTSWGSRPLASVPPPDMSPVPSGAEWQAFQAAPLPKLPAGKRRNESGTHRETVTYTGAMRHYTYTPGTVYAVPTSPSSPTYLVLPPGERLAAPPTLDPEAWTVGVVQMGQEATRQEAVVLRPLQPGPSAFTALFLQSGMMLFCKLVPIAKPGLMAVTWDLPQATPSLPVTPVALRPPTIDVGRLHTQYRIEPQGKLTPPWVPVRVFDDGTRTYIHFREALTYTRAPGVFGVTPQGQPALVQSHLYTVPGRPEQGAWLIVQGLWPALELKDSTSLAVRLVRQAPPRPSRPEGSVER